MPIFWFIQWLLAEGAGGVRHGGGPAETQQDAGEDQAVVWQGGLGRGNTAIGSTGLTAGKIAGYARAGESWRKKWDKYLYLAGCVFEQHLGYKEGYEYCALVRGGTSSG